MDHQRPDSIEPICGGRIIRRTKDGQPHITIQISGDALARQILQPPGAATRYGPRAVRPSDMGISGRCR